MNIRHNIFHRKASNPKETMEAPGVCLDVNPADKQTNILKGNTFIPSIRTEDKKSRSLYKEQGSKDRYCKWGKARSNRKLKEGKNYKTNNSCTYSEPQNQVFIEGTWVI